MPEGPYQGHIEPANTKAYCVYAKETFLATVGTAAGWEGGFVCAHNLANGKILWFQELAGYKLRSVAPSPSGDRLVTAGYSVAGNRDGGIVILWSAAESGALVELARRQLPSLVESVWWPTPGEVIAGTRDPGLLVLRSDTLESVSTLQVGSAPIVAVRGNPDGRLLGGVAKDGRVWVLDLEGSTTVFEYRAEGWLPFDDGDQLCWSPSGRWLAVCLFNRVTDGTRSVVRVWDTHTWDQLGRYEGQIRGRLWMAFPRDDALTIFESTGPTWRPRALNMALPSGRVQQLPWKNMPYKAVYFAGGHKLAGRLGIQKIGVWEVLPAKLRRVWLKGSE